MFVYNKENEEKKITMTSKKTKIWFAFVVAIAFVLMASVAMGAAVVKDNQIASARAARDGNFLVSDMQVGDYVSSFGEFQGHSLTWRVIGQDDAGNKLIRTDRALADADGKVFAIPYDDITKNNQDDYAGNVSVDAYLNTDVQVKDSGNDYTKTRKVVGTNFWGDASIRAWLNAGFKNAINTGGSYDESKNTSKLLEYRQKQLLWWGDATSKGRAENNGNDVNDPAADMNTGASNYLQLLDNDNGVAGTQRPNPIKGMGSEGTEAHIYRHMSSNVASNWQNAYGYYINDMVTLMSAEQVDNIGSTGGEILRNATGHPYSSVLAYGYTPSADNYKNNSSGTVATWLRTPLAENVADRDSNTSWSKVGGRMGTAARITGDDNYNVNLNVDSAARLVDGSKVTGDQNDQSENYAIGGEGGWVGVAPTVWLSASASFANKDTATNNPGEKKQYFTFTDADTTPNSSGANYDLGTVKYLQIYSDTISTATAPAIDFTSQLKQAIQECWGVANADDINLGNIKLNGVGSFPRGLQIDLEQSDVGALVSAKLSGAPSLVDTTDPNVASKSFKFQIELPSKASNSVYTAEFSITVEKNEADLNTDTSSQPKVTIGQLDTQNNLVYEVNGKGTIFGDATQLQYHQNPISASYERVKISDGKNGVDSNNDFVNGAIFNSYGVYGDTLEQHQLPSPATDANPVGWKWSDPATTTIGKATRQSTFGVEGTGPDYNDKIETDYNTNSAADQTTNTKVATYRDANYDLKTLTRSIDFVVEQAIPTTKSPVFVSANPGATNADFQQNLVLQSVHGADQSQNGDWNTQDPNYTLELGTGADSIKYVPTQFVPEDGNYAVWKESTLAMYISNINAITLTIQDKANQVAQLNNKAYKDVVNVSLKCTFKVSGVDGVDENTEYPINPSYRLKAGNVTDAQLRDFGLVFDSKGVISGGLSKSGPIGTANLIIEAFILDNQANETTPESIDFGKVNIAKAEYNGIIPTLPNDGDVKATYGQKLSSIKGWLGDNRFDVVNGDSTFDHATPQLDPNDQNAEYDYTKVDVTFTMDENYKPNTGLTVSVLVDRARYSQSEIPALPTIADVKFQAGAKIGDIALPDGWHWSFADDTIGGVGQQSTFVFYNNDSANYYNSEPIPFSFKVVPAANSSNIGMIIGIIAAVVVVLAGAAVAFVLINKKKTTNTKAGSRGNRF